MVILIQEEETWFEHGERKTWARKYITKKHFHTIRTVSKVGWWHVLYCTITQAEFAAVSYVAFCIVLTEGSNRTCKLRFCGIFSTCVPLPSIFLAQRSGSVTVCAVVPLPCRPVLLGDSRLLLEMGDRELRRCHWAANRGHLIFDTLFFLLKRLWGRSR